MKKVNPYAAGVVGFAGLVLLLAVAAFVGPRNDFPVVEDYISDSLETIIANSETRRDHLRDEIARQDCQSALVDLRDLNLETQKQSAWLGSSYRDVLAETNKTSLLKTIGQRMDEVDRLNDESWKIIEHKLLGCIKQAGN